MCYCPMSALSLMISAELLCNLMSLYIHPEE